MTPQSLRRWWPVAAVVLLLGIAVLATSRSSVPPVRVGDGLLIDQPTQPPPTEPTRAQPTGSAAPAEAYQSPPELPGWVAPLFGIGCLAVVLGVAVLAVVIMVRDRFSRRVGALPTDPSKPRRARAAETAGEVVAALDAGLEELSDRDADPRRAVIACWVRLERAAAAAGTPVRPDDTSTDLVGRLLTEHAVSAPVLTAFADVYRQARYTARPVEESMRAQARAAVARLRAELDGEVRV